MGAAYRFKWCGGGASCAPQVRVYIKETVKNIYYIFFVCNNIDINGPEGDPLVHTEYMFTLKTRVGSKDRD
jgi:hypothetical protein